MAVRSLRRRFGRRRLWKLAFIAGALALTLLVLYWHADYVVSREVGGNMKQSLDSAWRNWNALIESLDDNLEISHFRAVPSVDCQSQPQAGYLFCDPTLSPQKRATDLVSRLTLEELIDQTSSIAPAIPRLGINAYNWRSNCLHGWSKSGGRNWLGYTWTVFPAPIGLGATFDFALVKDIGRVTSHEGRALHNELLANFNGESPEAGGLNCFSPNVNIFRDPRWGRGQETFGEDPLIVSRLGVAYTLGLQFGTESQKYLKVAACAKHYSVHSGPEDLRFTFVADVTLHDLYDTYLPAFKSQVLAGNVSQIMPAYNGIKCKLEPAGVPCSASNYLLKNVLRNRFGASNISVCSDNTAIKYVTSSHNYTKNHKLSAAVCINATTDIDLGFDRIYPTELGNAFYDKFVEEATIKNSVWRSFYLRIKLGDFDPPELVPYQNINAKSLNTPRYQTLNLQAARESIVLLKNLGDRLPLHANSLSKLAVIGPNAKATDTLLSNYHGIPPFIISIYQGLKDVLDNTHVDIEYQPGCMDVMCTDTSLFEEALDVVHNADFVIMVMGLDQSIEREGRDRPSTNCMSDVMDNLALPGCQEKLIENVISYNPRVILVLINGGPVSISNLYTNRGVTGIIEAFYPGPLGGRAVADVLFGRYNPGGKMPITTYRSTRDILPSTNYNMDVAPGWTYKYYSEEPLIPFGYGLSYTTFQYSNLDISATTLKSCDSLKVSASVQNVGNMDGEEVIQVYITPPRIADKPFIPNTQLVGFERVSIDVTKVHVTTMELHPYLLSLVDEDGEHYLFPGQYTVVVTGGLEEARLTGQFTMKGPVTNVRDCPGAPQCLAC